MPPADLARRALGVAHYLLERGAVLADGDTVGVSAGERIRVRFEEEPHLGGPVYALSVERADGNGPR